MNTTMARIIILLIALSEMTSPCRAGDAIDVRLLKSKIGSCVFAAPARLVDRLFLDADAMYREDKPDLIRVSVWYAELTAAPRKIPRGSINWLIEELPANITIPRIHVAAERTAVLFDEKWTPIFIVLLGSGGSSWGVTFYPALRIDGSAFQIIPKSRSVHIEDKGFSNFIRSLKSRQIPIETNPPE